MTKKYNLIVIGSGPGGYVAAIRAAQLGMEVAVVEKESLGGICLNWGCIPTKALLKSAQVFQYIKNASTYGIQVADATPNFNDIIQRSRDVASDMSKGIHHLFKKNKITLLSGRGKIRNNQAVTVTDEKNKETTYQADHIIIATGACSKSLPSLPIDHTHIVGYREAMFLKKQPQAIVIVGGGAIGVEFAYFYNAIGTKVTLIEYMPQLLPLEDEDIAKQATSSFKKSGITVYTNTEVVNVNKKDNKCEVILQNKKEDQETITCDIVLSAVGVTANLTDIGLEENGITVLEDKIVVDEFYNTSIPNVYAIGDVIKGPALAHVASAEGILCVEKIGGLAPEVLDYNNIPSCTYCQPEVASVGYTEKSAQEAGYTIKVGKFPFSASGKAHASGTKEGFVKVIFDAKYGEWLGAHMVGSSVTEMIAEVVVARKLETTGHEILKSIHPHPTMSEAILEAVAGAFDEVIHL